MHPLRWLVLSAVLAVIVSGCGKSSSGVGQSSAPADGTAASPTATHADNSAADGPATAIHVFLEALRTGDDAKAAKMLTTTAREKMAALNRNVTPPASDTARFAVGEVEYINEDGARVACTWTDLDEQGQPKTDQAVWVLRHEEQGWRVAGVATPVFPGEEPLLLNFEDPEEMFRKQQWVRAEIQRRAEAASFQAQGDEKEEKSLRR